MKPLTTLLTLLILTSAQLLAQWQPEVQLTNNTESRATNKSIAVSGGVVHVVWCDKSDEIWQVYYKRSTNSGASWQAVKRLTNTTVSTLNPSLSVSGDIVNVFWRYESSDMYQTRSLNAGVSWLPHNKIASTAFWPSVAVSGSTLHLVWGDYKTIYYKRSTNGGSTWNTDTKFYDKSIIQYPPSVAVSGQFVHVVWGVDSSGIDSKPKIYYKRSTDGGKSWGADKNLPDVQNTSSSPSVAVSGQEVYVVWHDSRNALSTDIYLKRSPDGGTNWRTDKRLTNHPESSYYPSISVSGQNVHLIWHNKQVYYNRSINGGVSWEVDTAITNSTASVHSPSIFANGQSAHVVWHNRQNIFYKHLLKESTKKGLFPKDQRTTTPDEQKDEEKEEKADEPKRDEEKIGDEKKADEKKDTEKWVITPSGAKGATGTVSINLPEGVEWHLDITSSDDKALGKWDDRWNNKKTINLIPGKYNIFFTYLPVRGVPVQKGMNTRLKAGILNVVTAGQWSLHDESKEKVYVIYYKPSKIGLPVGRYNLNYNEQYQLIEIKEGEVTEF